MHEIIPDPARLCHNGGVSSFRDRFNPEAVHFPSTFRAKVLIICGVLLVLLSLLSTYYVEPRTLIVVIDTILCAAAVAFLVACWPDSLRTDQFGVWRESVFPFRRVFVPWKEVASVEEKKVHRGFLSSHGIDNNALVVYSSDGKRIIHGPEHSDRPRFLHELSINGVEVHAEKPAGNNGE